MLSGRVSERVTSARRTVESASLSWPTADTQNSRDGTKRRLASGVDSTTAESLHHRVARVWPLWPTPDVSGAERSEDVPHEKASDPQRTLGTAARFWPTHTVSSGAQVVGHTPPGTTGGTTLAGAAQSWPTPTHALQGGRPDAKERGWGEDLASVAAEWPTPDTGESQSGHGRRGVSKNPRHQSSKSLEALAAKIAEKKATWLTPNAQDCASSGSLVRPALTAQSRAWATPAAHDGRRPGADLASTQGANLSRDAATWATPNARDWKDSGEGTDYEKSAAKSKLAGEAVVVTEHWGSPRAGIRPTPMSYDRGRGNLEEQVGAFDTRQGQETPTAGDDGSPKAVLNPRFVEALMGYPPGWTSFAHLETPSSLNKPQKPSESSRSDSD
jgi:DNA (cytosine-5)-methyltransferase 1